MPTKTSNTRNTETDAQQRTERFGLRLTPDELARIRLGADAKKMTVSAFMIHAALSMVDSAIEEDRHTVVSKAVFDRIMSEIEEPGEVLDGLAMILKGHRKVQPLR